MKIAILSNDHASYVRPMADGLARMLTRIGEDPLVLYEGWAWAKGRGSLRSPTRRAVRNAGRRLANAALGRHDVIQRSPKRIEAELRASDLVVFVAHLPGAFRRDMHRELEACREWLDRPIVLYDLVHPTARKAWISQLLDGTSFGLERYDWYLGASAEGDARLIDTLKPWSRVGMDLRDPGLTPARNERFSAVLDFPREGFEHERALQIEALEELGIPSIALDRPMSTDRIRCIYRKAGVFFLSFPESFGLPIVEVQLCGGYICMPSASWAPAHRVDGRVPGSGPDRLPGNFIVYQHDKALLKRELSRIRASHNPDGVVREFERAQPHLYRGDTEALRAFTAKVREGEITSRSHLAYAGYNSRARDAMAGL
jgi:hypothetical protein